MWKDKTEEGWNALFDRKEGLTSPMPAVLNHPDCVTGATLPESLFNMEV